MTQRQTKQVIVMRKDLNMRKGKMTAQGAHASLAVFTNGLRDRSMTTWRGIVVQNPFPRTPSLSVVQDDPVYQWFENSFTKICVGCEGEDQLQLLVKEAHKAGIPAALITDNGKTEFGGVATNTCCAIGPWWSDEVDEITGELPLL